MGKPGLPYQEAKNIPVNSEGQFGEEEIDNDLGNLRKHLNEGSFDRLSKMRSFGNRTFLNGKEKPLVEIRQNFRQKSELFHGWQGGDSSATKHGNDQLKKDTKEAF